MNNLSFTDAFLSIHLFMSHILEKGEIIFVKMFIDTTRYLFIFFVCVCVLCVFLSISLSLRQHASIDYFVCHQKGIFLILSTCVCVCVCLQGD
jgi:hypothetical protein